MRGQFTTQDPILRGVPSTELLFNPQALNYYSYALDNPIVGSDPSGLRAFTAAEIAYNQETFTQINHLYTIGKGDVGLQMYNNLMDLIHEIEGIPTGGGGNFVGGGGGGVQVASGSVSSGGGSAPVASSGGGSGVVNAVVTLTGGGGYSNSGGLSQGSSGGIAAPAIAFLGAIWQTGNNGDQMIDGIYYIDHALDRMAPKGLWLEEAGGEGSRGIPPSVVKNAIQYGVQSVGNSGRTIFTYQNVKVVVESAKETARLGIQATAVVSVMLFGE